MAIARNRGAGYDSFRKPQAVHHLRAPPQRRAPREAWFGGPLRHYYRRAAHRYPRATGIDYGGDVICSIALCNT